MYEYKYKKENMLKIWQTIMNLTGWNIKMQINLFWLFLVFFSLARFKWIYATPCWWSLGFPATERV